MPLQILAMGLTPAGYVTAPVVVVEDLEELISENVVGKIVLVAPPSWTSYGILAKTRYSRNFFWQPRNFFLATTKLFIESGNVYIETKRNVDPHIAFLMHPCVVAWRENQD